MLLVIYPNTGTNCGRKINKFVGLAVARWEADFASPEAKQAVQNDLREAQQLGVNSVPTLIFDQRWILPEAVPESTLRQIVENLLEGKEPTAR